MVMTLILLVDLLVRLLVLLIIVHVVLSYFMSPFHPIRQWVDRIIEPMLLPIRRFVPPVGMFDFSPLVLLILVEIAGNIVQSALRAVFY